LTHNPTVSPTNLPTQQPTALPTLVQTTSYNAGTGTATTPASEGIIMSSSVWIGLLAAGIVILMFGALALLRWNRATSARYVLTPSDGQNQVDNDDEDDDPGTGSRQHDPYLDEVVLPELS
jgi:hypothetical protein